MRRASRGLRHSLPFVVGCALLLSAAGCEGPSRPSLIKDEPQCADFKGGTKTLKGGLKRPIRLRVLEGKDVIATVMIFGVPSSSKEPTRFLLPDTNAEYSLEWGLCANERAASEFDPRDRKTARTEAYQCGEPTVYATTKHKTTKGDDSTHDIPIVLPDDYECWAAPAAEAPASASASEAPPPPPSATATAEVSAAPSATPSASASADASASASISASASAPSSAAAGPSVSASASASSAPAASAKPSATAASSKPTK
ncbi:MAG: hypothetical protein U0271_43225 [Polyangiaceae bacterium]